MKNNPKIRNGDKVHWIRPNGERVPVKVMVQAENYAMVRRPNSRPFVADLDDLDPRSKLLK